MSKITPNYYAILTADVRYDKRLSASEKLLFAEITALTHSNGHCHATNEYLASLYDLSADRVSHMISKLVKLGYLNSVINYKEGTKQVESRHLSLPSPIAKFNYTSSQKDREGIAKNSDTPIAKNSEDNNTSIEQYKNNKEKIYKKENCEIKIDSIEKPDYISDSNWTQFKNWWNLRLENHKKLKSTRAALEKQLAIIKDLDNKTIAKALKLTISGDANAVCYQNIIIPKETIPIGKSNPHVFDDQDYDNAQQYFRVPINQPPKVRSQ